MYAIRSYYVYSVLIGFSVKVHPDARDFLQESTVKVFTSDVIYRLVEDYQKYVKEQQDLAEKKIVITSYSIHYTKLYDAISREDIQPHSAIVSISR